MKIKVYSVLYLLNFYLSGLLIPVMSLLLIDRGASLSNLSIILGLYAFTVVVLELPTGIMADVFGRKKTFCLSLLISSIGFAIIYFGRGFLAMCAGIMFYGFSRALASGSFDALFIDYYIEHNGSDKLHNITTRLAVLEALGLAAGAISGGFFPKLAATYFPVMGIYDINLVLRILLSLVVALLSLIFIEEHKKPESSERITIKQHVKNSSAVIVANNTVICIFLSVFATGFFLSSIETYWQPHFISLLPSDDMMGLLGIMAFLYLAAATLGSIASNRVIKKNRFNPKKLYLGLRLLLSFALMITALQNSVPYFILSYSAIYLTFGMANVPEGAILNGEVPSEVRASVLSVYSFIFQVGGLIGSVVYSILINYVTIPQIWLMASAVVFVTVIITAKRFLSHASSISHAEQTQN
ncbi:MAG: MFS transporter [Sedimentibacter sp.]|uniref:MFS transporter n=1 Tax=Sedimentibacter sp. TaxID=1960295 RepID=UPI003158784C